MLKPAVDIFPDEQANLANSTKLVVAATDYLRDVGLHRQLTIKMDPEVTNRLRRTDHQYPALNQCQSISRAFGGSQTILVLF